MAPISLLGLERERFPFFGAGRSGYFRLDSLRKLPPPGHRRMVGVDPLLTTRSRNRPSICRTWHQRTSTRGGRQRSWTAGHGSNGGLWPGANGRICAPP